MEGRDGVMLGRVAGAAATVARQREGLEKLQESLSFLFYHIDWNDRPQEQQLYILLRQGLVDAATKLGLVARDLDQIPKLYVEISGVKPEQ